MDLSNLRTSLREEETSSQRRSAHLRAAEDELNAYFRSSALGLTTLYRQGVAASKASYEKGYAHALAHVLELWDKDRDWLKGYLQRRIEAIEAADAEDDGEDAQLQQQQQQQPQRPTVHDSPVRPSGLAAARQAQAAADSPRQTNKRSRALFNDASTSSSSHRDQENAERRTLHRMPHASAASRSSSTNFASSSFDFSALIPYPSATSAAPSSSSPSKRPSRVNPDAPIIKTSNAATSRRKLQKLKGLRAGRDRIIEIEKPHDGMMDVGEEDEILPDGVGAEDADAWTDDEDAFEENQVGARKAGGRGKKVVVWAERSAPNSTHSAHAPQAAEGKVLERMDRRKRRRSNRQQEDTLMGDEQSSADVSREEAGAEYGYHS